MKRKQSSTILEAIVSGVLCLEFALLLVKLILWFRGRLLKRKEKLKTAAQKREQELRDKLLSELGGINQMSMSQLMSASGAKASSADRQVDGALAGPMRVAGERMDTLTYP